MAVLHKEIEMDEHGKHRGRHRKERSYRDVPSIPDSNRPRQKGICKNCSGWWFESIQELLKRGFHLRHNSFKEANKVGAANLLGWGHVGDGAEADAVRLTIGAD